MSASAIPASHDPMVRSIMAQSRAINLLSKGLRPKQVGMLIGLSLKKIQLLRAGLVSEAERKPRTPATARTILRVARRCIAASMFVEVYRRQLAGVAADPEGYLFEESYRLYALALPSWPDRCSVLPIDDAFTIAMALRDQDVDFAVCEEGHPPYLVMPNHSRGWRCPHCSIAASREGLPKSSFLARAIPYFGLRAGNIANN